MNSPTRCGCCSCSSSPIQSEPVHPSPKRCDSPPHYTSLRIPTATIARARFGIHTTATRGHPTSRLFLAATLLDMVGTTSASCSRRKLITTWFWYRVMAKAFSSFSLFYRESSPSLPPHRRRRRGCLRTCPRRAAGGRSASCASSPRFIRTSLMKSGLTAAGFC